MQESQEMNMPIELPGREFILVVKTGRFAQTPTGSLQPPLFNVDYVKVGSHVSQ